MQSSSTELMLRPGVMFNGVRVFSATLHRDRDQLGENVTKWIADHPQASVVSIVMAQSSDASFHCVTCALFFRT